MDDYVLLSFPNKNETSSLVLFFASKYLNKFISGDELLKFWEESFPKITPLIPNLKEKLTFYVQNPRKIGYMMETECYPWSFNKTCLIGDSAHAMLPALG